MESIPLALIVALAGALTGLMMAAFGVGGGAFVVPILDALFSRLPGVEQPPFKLAVIASLVAIGIGSSWRAARVWHDADVDRRSLQRLMLGLAPAAVLGVALASVIHGDALRGSFAVVLLVLGLWTIFGHPTVPAEEPAKRPLRRRLYSIGAFAGLASSLFGLGGATLLVPLLTMTSGFSTVAAVNVSIIFVFLASVLSLAAYAVGYLIGMSAFGSVTVLHLELVALMTATVIVVQQLALRWLHDLTDRPRRVLLGAYLLLAAAWMVRSALT